MVVFLGYDPRRQYVYRTMVDYFQDPVLYKTESKKPEEGMDVWAIKIVSYLMKERRFLIAMVPTDPSIVCGEARRLSDLMWTVLQTRNLVDEDEVLDRLPSVRYDVRRDAFQGYVIRLEKTTDDVTTYTVEPSLPIKIHLLHRKKGPYEYSEQGTILAAIETFQTLVCMLPATDLHKEFDMP